MFCLWKKSAAAPCSCAYQLRGPMTGILDQLRHHGKGTLVMRQPGLSLAKSTRFDPFVCCQENGRAVLRDTTSGLETSLHPEQNIYLLTDLFDRHPLLGIGKPGAAIELSIRLDGLTWESPAVTALIRQFEGTPLDCLESRKLGAGAWLDDWGLPATLTGSEGVLIREACNVMRTCSLLEIEIHSAAHRNITRFSPSFIDSEGDVLRIADRACQHVVFADVAAAEFRLTRLSDTHVRIFSGCPPAFQPAA